MVVYDIRRGAIHNGPGIRTMVHFKGCPLRCKWCAAPESQEFAPQLSYSRMKCISCGLCSTACRDECISVAADEKVDLDFSACTACMACADACPSGALAIEGYEWTPQSLLRELKKDEILFRETNGGVTLSGGEPLAQNPEDLEELLRLLKGAGITVGIDTSGYAGEENLMRILPYVDFFLWDLKLITEAAHKQYTGVSRVPILRNLRLVSAAFVPVYLRCPLIPGVNTDEKHLQGIIKTAGDIANLVRIDLLPLHHLGTSRYEKLGRKDPFEDAQLIPDPMLDHWIHAIRSAGYPVKLIR